LPSLIEMATAPFPALPEGENEKGDTVQ
jgi:hypothetical protein